MNIELDHLFICTSAGAPEADRLLQLGFTEGAGNVHPGQGTSCRRFFFSNSYLELLWVHDEEEAQSPAAAPLRLFDRWRERKTNGSPFGLAFRPTKPGTEPIPLPFRVWPYRPPYLPPPLHIDIGENCAETAEPLLFHLGFGQRPDRQAAERRQPMEHANRVKEITAVRITMPQDDKSAECEAIAQLGQIGFARGNEHLMEISFDDEMRGEIADCRPLLPLVLRW